jgi:PAS domain-containing protein
MQIGIVTNAAAVAILKKKRDDELRVRETQLADAQKIAHFGSFEWLPETDTVRWTEELFRIFGLEPGAFQPSFEHYLERVHPEDREAIRDMIHQTVIRGTPFEGKERILRPDGSIRVLYTRGQWLFDESRQTRKLVGACQDITP